MESSFFFSEPSFTDSQRIMFQDEGMNAPFQRDIAGRKGHVFRSVMVDAIARLEKWTLQVLQDTLNRQGTEKRAKIPQFVTQRVKSVKDLETVYPKLMHSWGETKLLLDQLEEFWTLRSALVHAIMTTTIGDDGTVYFTFENTGAGNQPAWDRRKTFSESELGPLVERAGLLVDSLYEQVRNQPG